MLWYFWGAVNILGPVYMEVGGAQVGEVTCLGEVKKKNNPPLQAILQPRHPGVHFLKIIEWLLST